MNGKLPAGLKFADATIRPSAGDYEIVFSIIVPPGKPLEIPFFSKVSFRNARRLLTYGYTVTKKRIQSVAAAAV